MSVTTRYHERLRVPVGWWLIALFFGGSIVLALGFYLGWQASIGITVAVTALLVGALWRYGSTAIVVDDLLRVGGNKIDFAHVAGAAALDEAATTARMGPDANAAALLVTRPYVGTAVEITVADTADPHPYWLVSTRHPEELAAAVAAACGERVAA